MIERLKNGLKHFKDITYKENEHLYHKLEKTQHPHTLFIACSDSRVHPAMLIDSKPGEVFTIRNIANTIPPLEESEKDLTTLSAIEYAVEVLEVEQVIICGHSNCGGCAAALAGTDTLSDLPYTQAYLKPLEKAKELTENNDQPTTSHSKAELMEKYNIIEQLTHLKEYSFIKDRLQNNQLAVEGWHYDIGSGIVLVYDEQENKFSEPTTDASTA